MSEYVCDLSVFTAEEREKHLADSRALFGRALEARDLPDGYAVRLPTGAETLMQMAEFIRYDRLCCPFITFGIEVEANGGGMWLRLAGGAEIKAGLAGEFAGLLDEAVAAAAGLAGSQPAF
jgi:hypothetical protein